MLATTDKNNHSSYLSTLNVTKHSAQMLIQ